MRLIAFLGLFAVAVLLSVACSSSDDTKSSAPTCAELQTQVNSCQFEQSTKDNFGSFCAGVSEACRTCLNGVICGVTEQCDPQCGKASGDAG